MGRAEEMEALRFLGQTGRALVMMKRDAVRELEGMDEVRAEVVSGLDRVLREVAEATGIVRSQAADREVAFLSSVVERVAEEL